MNKKRKTYGIKGFMEYQAVIKVGKGRMKVQFSGGHMNAMGIVPCTFSSENYMTQHAIENSKEYKDGLIYIVSAVTLDGNVEIERPASTGASALCGGRRAEAEGGRAFSPADKPADAGGDEAEAEGGRAFSPADKPADAGGDEAEAEAEAVEAPLPPEGGEAEAALTPVEFASNDEAKDYLEQQFGLVRSKLRNRDDIRAAGKAHGLEIFFI